MISSSRKWWVPALPVSVSLLLAACGGGGSGTGTLTLGITDAPVDGAQAVWVRFTGVEIQPAGGARIDIDYTDVDGNPTFKDLNLLALQGGLRDFLLDGETLEAGSYNWIRLKVQADPATDFDSYVVLNDGSSVELRIPSGAESGLKLNRPFTITEGADSDFTVDFDLRKSLHDPVGQPEYILRPTLRIVSSDEAQAIEGTVDATYLTDNGCVVDETHAVGVYVYEGADAVPDDIGGAGTNPLATSWVALNDGTGAYEYRVAFLPPGEYTVALTCEANNDTPDADEDINFLETVAPVTVPSNGDATVNFPSGA